MRCRNWTCAVRTALGAVAYGAGFTGVALAADSGALSQLDPLQLGVGGVGLALAWHALGLARDVVRARAARREGAGATECRWGSKQDRKLDALHRAYIDPRGGPTSAGERAYELLDELAPAIRQLAEAVPLLVEELRALRTERRRAV